jgi:bacillithiol biosynthesis cysteine-adding enzyme BshC
LQRPFVHSYLAGDPAAQPFFSTTFRDARARLARVRAAATRKTSPSLLRVLAEQQAMLPASPARQAQLDKLAAGGCAVVATGQQVGLFLGPLYAFYKAASAIAVARALQEESGVPCVPLFWLQTEDHDFEEIRTARVADAEGDLVLLSLPDEDERLSRSSVAYRTLPARIEELVDTLAQALGEAGPAQEVASLLRASYRPGVGMADAFAIALASVFAQEGLLILNPRAPDVAELAAPIYRTCLEDEEAIERALRDRERAIEDAQFHAQVPVRDRGALVFFHPDSAEGPRFRLQRRLATSPASRSPEQSTGPTWALAGASASVAHDELLGLLARDPLRFSTSALLRPIVQDHLLPVTAYVAGPGEINYFAQLGPLYDHFHIEPPLLVPRARFRCVDARTRRRLNQLGLSTTDIGRPATELHGRLRPSLPEGTADPHKLREIVQNRIAPAMDELTAQAALPSPSLRRAGERTSRTVTRALKRLLARYAREVVERDLVTVRRLHEVEQSLNPDGVPQERFYSWPSLAGRIGVREFKRLVFGSIEAAGPFATEVQEIQP